MSDPNLWINRTKERIIETIDPESIFSGKASDVPSIDLPPNASNLVELVQSSDDAKSPFTSGNLKSLFGSKYESSMSAVKTIASGFGGISLSTHLSHMGFGGIAKTLLSSSGISGLNLPKIDISSLLGKTSFSYKDYEELVSNSAPNLPFNANAQGFPSLSIQVGQSSEISSEDLDHLNKLRKRVHEFVINWKSNQQGIYDSISSLDDETLNEFNENFNDGFYNEVVVGNLGNLLSEVSSSSQFIQSFAIQVERFVEQNENIPEDIKGKIETSISNLTKLYETSIEIKRDGEQILDRSSESLSEFSQEDVEISPISFVNGLNSLVGSSCSSFNAQFGGQLRNVSLDGHSSVSRAATSFSNKGPSVRDAIAPSIGESPKRNEIASPAPGRSDPTPEAPEGPVSSASVTAQLNQMWLTKNKTQSGKYSGGGGGSSGGPGGVGPLTSSDFEKYKNILGKRESGNKYNIKERKHGNYLGRWQFGAGALADTGFVKKGTSNRGTRRDSAWRGRLGVNSRKDWLSNKNNCQDVAIKEFARNYYKAMLRNGALKRGSSKNHAAGMIAASHLSGPGGAKKLSRGITFRDGNGTAQSSYYNMMQGKF